MKNVINRPTAIKALVQLYLLSRSIINTSKKYDKDKSFRLCIAYLLAKKPMTIKDLAKNFSVNHSFMSLTIKDMKQLGYVEEKIDPKDQRFKQIYLSKKGEKFEFDAGDEGGRIAGIYFKKMTNDQIVDFEKLMSKINLEPEKVAKS